MPTTPQQAMIDVATKTLEVATAPSTTVLRSPSEPTTALGAILPSGGVISASLGTTAILITVAGYLYSQYKKKSERLSRKDKEQYDKLCDAYVNILGLSLPKEWALDDDNRPLHCSTLLDSSTRFQDYLAHLDSMSFSMKTTVVQTVAYIQKLFQSLNKRKGITSEKYRKDGFEAMFFTELALWLSVVYPGHSATAQGTADMLAKRITYCEKIEKEVLLFRGDGKITNAISQLRRIISNLKVLHSDVTKSIQTASFSAQIHEIDCKLKEMIVSAFNLCHLVITGVNQEYVHVGEFLAPDKTNAKVQALLNTMMGSWIKATFELAGIKEENFDPTYYPSIALIDSHLEEVDFSKVDLSKSGLLDFARNIGSTSQEKSKNAINFLKQVRNIHRAILNACYLRHALKLAMLVGQDEGHAWLHGDKYGSKMVRGILMMIEHAHQRLAEASIVFWQKFYTETYQPYALINDIDTTNKTHAYLILANGRINNIVQKSAAVVMALDKLKDSITRYLTEPEHSRHRIVALASSVCEYIEGRAMEVHEDWIKDLKAVANGTVVHDSITISPITYQALLNTSAYRVRFPLHAQPIFNLLGHSPSKITEPKPHELKLLSKPTLFHSSVQQHLYEHFLQSYQSAVEAPEWLSVCYGVSWLKISKLKCFYAELNQLLKSIYETPVVAGYQFLFKKPPVSAETIKLQQIYIELVGAEQIQYTLKNSKGVLITKTIELDELGLEAGSAVHIEHLKRYPEAILNKIVERGDASLSIYMSESEKERSFYELSREKHGALGFLKRVEYFLIDQHIVTRILKLAQELEYDELKIFALGKNPAIEFKKYTAQSKKFIELTLSPSHLIFVGGSFSDEIAKLKRDLEQEKSAHQLTLRDNAKQKIIIQQQAQDLAVKDAEIKEQAQQLMVKDAEIKEQAQQLMVKDAEIKEQAQQLMVKDAEIQEKGQQLAVKDTEIHHKGGMIQEMKSRIEELEQGSPLVMDIPPILPERGLGLFPKAPVDTSKPSGNGSISVLGQSK